MRCSVVTKERNEYGARIGDVIRALMPNSCDQKDFAKQMGITPQTLSQMLSGVAPLAIGRFFQLLALLNPPKGTLDYLFELYRKKLSAGRYDELTSIPVGNRTPLECKELEIIQLWNNSPVSTEKIADEVEVEELIELVKQLPKAQRPVFKSLMQAVIGNH